MNEIPNTDFAIRCPKVVCDIELEGVPEPFPSKSFHMAVVGRPGSGKTSLAINLIAEKSKGHRVYFRKFDHVNVLMPKGSLASLKDNPFESLPDDDVQHEFNLENLLAIEQKCEERSPVPAALDRFSQWIEPAALAASARRTAGS